MSQAAGALIPALALQAVGKEELTKAAQLFATLKTLRLRLTDVDEATLDRAFQQHTTTVLEKLDARLALLGDNNPLRRVEVVMAKNGLYDAAFQQVVALNSNVSPVLGDSLKELRGAHLGFLGEFQACVSEFMSSSHAGKKEAAAMKVTNVALKDECAQLLESVRLLDAEADAQQVELTEMQRKVRLAEQRSSDLERDLVAARKLSGAGHEKPRMDTRVEPQHKFLRTRTAPFSPSSTGTTAPLAARASSSSSSSPGKPMPASPRGAVAQAATGVSFDSASALQSPSTAQGVARKNSADLDWFYAFRVELQAMLDSGRCRTLSPHECKDALERIYADKTLAERRSKQSETMEHFLYRSMEKRYGLRSLAIEHTACLLRSVEEHASKDTDVLVFHKIYRNEIDEGYRHVHTELGKSIREMLAAQITGDYPTKDQSFLQQALDAKMGGSVSETEWGGVVKYLYNGADAAAISGVLKRRARDESHTGATLGSGSGKKTITRTDPKVPPPQLQLSTAAFLKTVLDFQLKSHENYLFVFRQAFDNEDADHDGVLTADEFNECFKKLRRSERKRSNGSASTAALGKASQFAKGAAKVVILRAPKAAEQTEAERTEADDAKDQAVFRKIIQEVDPLGTKRITFSAAAGGVSRIAASV